MTQPSKILITGATGFIGSRLCEMLTLDHHRPYRALVRSPSRAARIARLDAELALGDMADRQALDRALVGCHAVVNLAHSDDRAAAKEAETLVDACKRAGITTLVHVSSMAVHGPAPGLPIMHEGNAPIRRWGEAYSDAKAASEAVVRSASGLNTVTLRPTIVYGPYSGFVLPIIADANAGRVSLIDGGQGLCNAVYVDDVCDAIVAGLDRTSDRHAAYLINGDERLSWREFIEAFAGLVARDKARFDITAAEVTAHWQAQEPGLADSAKAALRLLASPQFHAQLASIPPLGAAIRGGKETLAQAVSPDRKAKLKRRLQGPPPVTPYVPVDSDEITPPRTPSPGRVVREGYQTFIVNDQAKAALDWRPRHSFAQGVAKTATWLSFAKLVKRASTHVLAVAGAFVEWTSGSAELLLSVA